MQNAELVAEPDESPGEPCRTRWELLSQRFHSLPSEYFTPLPDEPDLTDDEGMGSGR